MPENKHWFLVAYDIRDQKRWRKVFKKLHGYGRPIQLSIFRCRLSNRQLQRMRWEIEKFLDQEEDSLLVIGLCEGCAGNVISKNLKEVWNEDEKHWAIAG
jgi:CRISPR-associated protein Cas2